MKVYQTLAFLLLINYIICDKNYCKGAPSDPTKADDCTSKKNDGGYCCFVKYRDSKECEAYGPERYKHIVQYAKYLKKCHPKKDDDDDCEEYKDFSIECSSSYLIFSLLSLLILFL